jgi:hypothetical protein
VSGYRSAWSVALVNVPDGLEVFTFAERPDLESRVGSLPDAFPEFMYHDATVRLYWERARGVAD